MPSSRRFPASQRVRMRDSDPLPLKSVSSAHYRRITQCPFQPMQWPCQPQHIGRKARTGTAFGRAAQCTGSPAGLHSRSIAVQPTGVPHLNGTAKAGCKASRRGATRGYRDHVRWLFTRIRRPCGRDLSHRVHQKMRFCVGLHKSQICSMLITHHHKL